MVAVREIGGWGDAPNAGAIGCGSAKDCGAIGAIEGNGVVGVSGARDGGIGDFRDVICIGDTRIARSAEIKGRLIADGINGDG